MEWIFGHQIKETHFIVINFGISLVSSRQGVCALCTGIKILKNRQVDSLTFPNSKIGSCNLYWSTLGSICSNGLPLTRMRPHPRLQYATAVAVFWKESERKWFELLMPSQWRDVWRRFAWYWLPLDRQSSEGEFSFVKRYFNWTVTELSTRNWMFNKGTHWNRFTEIHTNCLRKKLEKSAHGRHKT